MRIVKIIFKVILFPLWPIFIGWKVAGALGFSVSTGSWSGGSSDAGPFIGRLVGTVVIAGLIYYGVFMALTHVLGISIPSNDGMEAATPTEAPSAEVAK